MASLQKDKLSYTEEKATRWLSWLARGMQKHGQTVFLIEQLQPTWLTSRRQLSAYALVSRLAVGLSLGFIVGVIFSLPAAYAANVQSGKSPMASIGEILDHPGEVLSGTAVVICVAGLLLGFGAAVLDLWRLRGGRFWALADELGTQWRSFAFVAIYFVGLTLLWDTLGGLAILGVWLSKSEKLSDIVLMGIFGIIFPAPCLALIGSSIWGPRAARQGQGGDIGTVETLGWSWATARKGVLQGFGHGFGTFPLLLLSAVLFVWFWVLLFMGAVGAGVGLITNMVARGGIRKAVRRGGKAGLVGGLLITSIPIVLLEWIIVATALSQSWFWLVVAALVGVEVLFGLCGGVIGGVFCGLQSKVVAIKTLPNQGIRLSLKNALAGGCLVAVPFGLAGAVVGLAAVLGADLAPATANGKVGIYATFYALAAAVVAGFFGALWYGGVDWLYHSVLRLILFSRGVLPLRLSRFLDYAANELHFLQKVGGGYMFIHRYLQEHFAALGDEGECEAEKTAELVTPLVAAG